MAGIAGVMHGGDAHPVEQMLKVIGYRGRLGRSIFPDEQTTIGVVWGEEPETFFMETRSGSSWVRDSAGISRLALAQSAGNQLIKNWT